MISLKMESMLLDNKWKYQIPYRDKFFLVLLPLSNNIYKVELTNVCTKTKTVYNRLLNKDLRQTDVQENLYTGTYEQVKWLYLNLVKLNKIFLENENEIKNIRNTCKLLA